MNIFASPEASRGNCLKVVLSIPPLTLSCGSEEIEMEMK